MSGSREPVTTDEGEELDSGGQGRHLYLDSRTGEITAHPKAPDAGLYYRLVGGDEEAAQSFQEGEYPLVVSDKTLKLPRDQRGQAIEQARREQYEDPGWLYEQNPDFEPGATDRPVDPPTSQAPMYPQDRHGSLADALAPRGTQGGTNAAEPAPMEPAPAAGPQSALPSGRRGSLADFLPAAQPKTVAQAMQPQLQRLPDSVAKRLQTILAKNRGPGVQPGAEPAS